MLLAVLMSANGIFRELVLARAMARETAAIVSVLLGVTIILIVTGVFFRRLASESVPALASLGALLVVLTVAFEFALGHYGEGKSWAELSASYAFWRGELWPFVLLVLGLTPLLWGRWLSGGRHS